MPRRKKGQQTVPILMKTTGFSPSRSFYSMLSPLSLTDIIITYRIRKEDAQINPNNSYNFKKPSSSYRGCKYSWYCPIFTRSCVHLRTVRVVDGLAGPAVVSSHEESKNYTIFSECQEIFKHCLEQRYLVLSAFKK